MQASEGYITFTMTDEQYNLHIALGGARFTTQQHVNDAWKSIPHFWPDSILRRFSRQRGSGNRKQAGKC